MVLLVIAVVKQRRQRLYSMDKKTRSDSKAQDLTIENMERDSDDQSRHSDDLDDIMDIVNQVNIVTHTNQRPRVLSANEINEDENRVYEAVDLENAQLHRRAADDDESNDSLYESLIVAQSTVSNKSNRPALPFPDLPNRTHPNNPTNNSQQTSAADSAGLIRTTNPVYESATTLDWGTREVTAATERDRGGGRTNVTATKSVSTIRENGGAGGTERVNHTPRPDHSTKTENEAYLKLAEPTQSISAQNQAQPMTSAGAEYMPMSPPGVVLGEVLNHKAWSDGEDYVTMSNDFVAQRQKASEDQPKLLTEEGQTAAMTATGGEYLSIVNAKDKPAASKSSDYLRMMGESDEAIADAGDDYLQLENSIAPRPSDSPRLNPAVAATRPDTVKPTSDSGYLTVLQN